MKVRDEIAKHALEHERPILLWLFERYHWESEWMLMARCEFVRYGSQSFQTHRVWHPSPVGLQIYYCGRLATCLRAVLTAGTTTEVETGIGMIPEPTEAAVAARALLDTYEKEFPCPAPSVPPSPSPPPTAAT